MKKKNSKIIVGALIVVLIAVVCIVAFKSCSNGDDAQLNEPGLVWDENAEEGGLVQRSEEEIQAELNEKVQQGMINISMNTTPVFPDGTSKGNLLIVNSERNNYPQVVYIVRNDTGEEVYRSGGIPVGSKIENAALDVDLPAGTYDCTAYFNNVDPETGTFLGTAGAEIQIVVQG